jgi:hypothetical protein
MKGPGKAGDARGQEALFETSALRNGSDTANGARQDEFFYAPSESTVESGPDWAGNLCEGESLDKTDQRAFGSAGHCTRCGSGYSGVHHGQRR